MKKRFVSLAAMAVCALGAFNAFAQSDNIYDFGPYGDDVITLFYNALQQGRQYPTDAEFEAAGFNLMDIAFVRSHVRPRSIMLDHTKDVNSNVTPGRKLWMNIPMGKGKQSGGYPSTDFGDDTFTGWNYTNVFGSWNHPFFRAPGVWVDAAHKNGTDIYSGIKFFDTTGGRGEGASTYMKFLTTKKSDGTYAYVEPLINALMYFGSDGINYNWEDSGYSDADIVGFHQACYKKAAEKGFTNFHIGLYTSVAALANQSYTTALLGSNGVKTADAFLNYSSSDFSSQIGVSAANAEKWFGDASDMYQGAWIVGMNRAWHVLKGKNASGGNIANPDYAKKAGIVLWGEHDQSRIFSYNQGNSQIEFQENYQKLQERFFSGGYRNPATRPAETNTANWQTEDPTTTGLRSFQGLAEYVPERTALQQNLPFTTYFNIGAGDRYNYKGNRTHGKWYNLGQQDVVPTYRWLVYKKGTTTAVKDGAGLPEFTPSDAYIGGSCLRLTNTQAVDINLYRTELKCTSGTPRATVALKFPPQGTTVDDVKYEKQKNALSVIVRKKGSDAWVETPLALATTNGWEEQTVALNGVAQGDVIEYIGLRTAGDTNGLLVGMLSINDDVRVQPSSLKNLVTEVKNEDAKQYSVKLRWDVEALAKTRANWNLVYNDEAGIDYFEVFVKNGQDGRVSEVARTTSWSAFVGDIEKPAGDLDAYIGVRGVSVDGKTVTETLWQHLGVSPNGSGNTTAGSTEYPTITNSPANADRYVHQVIAKAKTNLSQSWESNPANAGNYYMMDADALEVEQGGSVTMLNFIPEGLADTYVRIYADWDGNKDFKSNADEAIWSGDKSSTDTKGKYVEAQNAYRFQFNVPTDARTGDTRLRIVYGEVPTSEFYTIKLYDTDYYFTTQPVTSNKTTTYSLSKTPEKFYVTPVEGSTDGFTIRSAETGRAVGYTKTTTWDFSDQLDEWTINNIEGVYTTIYKKGMNVGFGADAVEEGKGVFTDKNSESKYGPDNAKLPCSYRWTFSKITDTDFNAHPGFGGTAINGYALDIPLKITGEGPQREIPVVAVEHDYPIIELDKNSQDWQKALAQRWLTRMESSGADQNISCAWSEPPTGTSDDANAPKTNYVLVEDYIRAHQGQTVRLTWTDARNGDGLNFCTARGYADWDNDGLFNAANDELIWSLGESNSKKANNDLTQSYSIDFTIPADAVPGKSRVRLVFSDAWFPHPGATGATNKGFAIDLPLEITGTNPARKPALDTHDAGLFEQPWGFGMGDLNDDEIISIYDITALVSILRNQPAATIRRKNAADVNMDGVIDQRDVEAAVSKMFGGSK